MTAQVDDTILYLGREFDITGGAGKALFDPAEHGISTRSADAASRDDYHCRFAVEDGRLQLDRVSITFAEQEEVLAGSGSGPVLFGSLPVRVVETFTLTGPDGESEYTDSHWEYRDLKAAISYTGELYMGAGLVDVGTHLGFASVWQYSELLQLTFEDGLLVAVADQSEEAEAFRAHLRHGDPSRKRRRPRRPRDHRR